MQKNVLLVHYSQTGQLTRVARQITAPLIEQGINVVEHTLQLQNPAPFPWPFWQFFDIFPECQSLEPPPLQANPADAFDGVEFDLVLLAYQVWFLAPSLPVTAFLQSRQAQRLLKGRPIITLVVCRNMWLTAQAKVLQMLGQIGARPIDHIAVVDQAPAWTTFITTPRWLLTGRSNAFCGLPAAGIAAAEVVRCRRFGLALADALAEDGERSGKPLLGGLGAARVAPHLLLAERAGARAFQFWSRVLRACGQPGALVRRLALGLFVLYLALMIVCVLPVARLLQGLAVMLLRRRMQALCEAAEQPSGAGIARCAQYETEQQINPAI